MSFQLLNRQERAVRILQNGLRYNRLSHAYIFHGPFGAGRRQAALTLAQSLYCERLSDDACGECIECRKIEHRNHPDVHWLEAEKSTIKIDQIRQLQRQLSYRSATAGRVIYIIDQAERMTIQASNSLLKFFEEPSLEVLAILITENGHALLPTIQSRAQWISFIPMSKDAMSEQLLDQGYSSNLISAAVHISSGILAAKELLDAAWFAEVRSIVIQLAKDIQYKYANALMTVQQKIIKTELSEHLDMVLDLFILWCKDMIQLKYQRTSKLVYTDEVDWMKKLALQKDVNYWVFCIEQIVQLKKRLRNNIQPQLALEKLIYDMQGESFCIPL